MLLGALSSPYGFPTSALLKTLRDFRTHLFNLSGSTGEILEKYQQWSSEAARSLGFYLDSEDVRYLVLTQRHWVLINTSAGGFLNQRINNLVDVERTDRLRIWDAEIEKLAAIEKAWADVDATVIAPDTNIYLHHERYFNEIDWCAALTAEKVRLLVPILVVRELDRAKRTAKNIPVSDTNPEAVRTRARVSGRRLRDLFVEPNNIVSVQTGVTAELLLDPLSHVAVDDPDTEMLSRLLTAKQLTGHQITVVTRDGNMQFSAKTAGLEADSLSD